MTDTWRTLKAWPELILEQLADAGVARVILNRPDKRNCLNETLVAAWFEALDIVRADRDIKVVITKGAGICFSSGLDLHFLRKVSEEPRAIGFAALLVGESFRRITHRVSGVVMLAAGLAMVLAHNIWSGGALVVVDTLVGWMTLIKSLVFLFLPPEIEARLFLERLHYQQLFYFYWALPLVLGLYLTYGGFRSPPQ